MIVAILSLLVIQSVLLMIILVRNNNAQRIADSFGHIAKNQERIERAVTEEIALNRTDINTQLKGFSDSIVQQLASLTTSNEQKLENIRVAVERQLKQLQDDNAEKLDKMREVVDEKLHATLEKRLSESFKVVSERLEQVHQGLGEMQTLAAGVGDLKKVLTNVKTRGTFGEIQLGNLLEQVLTRDQFATNVATKKGSSDQVEFAIKLPGRDDDGDCVWLPIDAKFPLEDYQRLIEAQEVGDIDQVKQLEKVLENTIKIQAKKIKEKYINPPATTDFAVMFLPIEGLYAEILRNPGLCDILQREYRIVPTGPTTITALVNSLQMGFRTLAVEKRASEVWQVLGMVKTEFGKFGDLLDKTHKKLQEASNTIESASRKSRTIQRKLRHVQELPVQTTAPELEELE